VHHIWARQHAFEIKLMLSRVSEQGCRGYGDSHGDSHGYGYGDCDESPWVLWVICEDF